MNKKRKVTKKIVAWVLSFAMVLTTVNLTSFEVKATAEEFEIEDYNSEYVKVTFKDGMDIDIDIDWLPVEGHRLSYNSSTGVYDCLDCSQTFEPGCYDISLLYLGTDIDAFCVPDTKYILRADLTSCDEWIGFNNPNHPNLTIIDFSNLVSYGFEWEQLDFSHLSGLEILDLGSLTDGDSVYVDLYGDDKLVVADFGSITKLTGDANSINLCYMPSLSILDLGSLTSVEGWDGVVIYGDPNLTTLDLGSLTDCSDVVDLYDNPSLVNLDLGSLTSNNKGWIDFTQSPTFKNLDLGRLTSYNSVYTTIDISSDMYCLYIHEGDPIRILDGMGNEPEHIIFTPHDFSDDTCQGVCACGVKNEAGNHNFSDGVCVCGYLESCSQGNHNFSDNGTCECGLTQLKYEVISSTDKTVRVTGLNDGVTAKGDLIIPKTVKVDGEDYLVIEIGYEAFKDCTGFTGKLVIPDSVTTIGRGAFSCCYGLTGELIIPDSVTTIGFCAFEQCGFTGEVIIPDTVTSLDTRVFSHCPNITSVSIPCSADPLINLGHKSYVVTHRDHDFSDDAYQGVCTVCWKTTITYTVISDADKTVRVTGLNDSVYTSGNLIIPKTVKFDGEDYRVTEIGEKAFYMNSKITGNVVIPDSIIAIGNYAFWGCTLANSIIILSEEPPIFGMETVIGKDVYVPCLSYEEYVNVLSGVAGYVGLNHDFSTDPFVCSMCGNSNEVSGNCGAEADGDNIKWTIVDDTTLLIQGSGAMADFVVDNVFGIIDTPWNEYCLYNEASIITNIQLSEGITHIGDYAFAIYTYDAIEYDEVSVIIPDSVESIGTNAFASNVNIQSVSIPCSLEYSDDWGIDEVKVTQRNHKFSGDCDTICNVCDYERVATGNHDFSADCDTTCNVCGYERTALEGHIFSDYVLSEDHETKTTTCEVCNETITESALIEEYEVEYRILDEAKGTLEVVKYSGSASCVVIPQIIEGMTVVRIGESAFAENDELEYVDVPTIISIGKNAFKDCTNLKDVNDIDDVESIEEGAFSGCRKLNEFGGSKNCIPFICVQYVGDYAFENCTALDSLLICNPNLDVSSISNTAFEGTNIEKIYIACGSSWTYEEISTFDSLKNAQIALTRITENGDEDTLYHDFINGFCVDCNKYECNYTGKHNFVDGTCEACGAAEPADKFVKIQAYLNDQIALDFKVFISESFVEKAEKMEFDVAGVKQYVNFADATPVTIEGKQCYVFRCVLNSTQMKDAITAKMIYTDETVGTSIDYSIEQYLEKVKETYPEDAVLMTLVESMATFGDCMKAYDMNDMENVPSVVLTQAEQEYVDNYKLDSTGINLEDAIDSIMPSKVNVGMGSLMSARVKYVCDEEDDYTFYVDGKQVTATKITGEDGKIYYNVASPYIAPADYGKTIVFTAKLGEAEENYLYSPVKYAIKAIAAYQGYDNYVSMFNSIIKYHYSAMEYNKTK